LLPMDRVHVDDQVADHGHVAHRLDRDHRRSCPSVGTIPATVLAAIHGVVRVSVSASHRVLEVGVTGERWPAVDANAARTADRLLAGAAHADRSVLLVLDL